MVLSKLPDPVVKAIRDAKVNDVTAWIDEDNAHVKYLVEGKAPEQQIPMTDALRNRIRRKMMLDKGVIKNNVAKDLSELRKTAKIDIKQKEFAAMYTEFITTYFHDIVQRVGGGGG